MDFSAPRSFFGRFLRFFSISGKGSFRDKLNRIVQGEDEDVKTVLVAFHDENNYIGYKIYWRLFRRKYRTVLFWKLNGVYNSLPFQEMFTIPHGVLILSEPALILLTQTSGSVLFDPVSARITETVFSPQKGGILGCYALAGFSADIIYLCVELLEGEKTEKKPTQPIQRFWGVKVNLDDKSRVEFNSPEILTGACQTEDGQIYLSGERTLYRLTGTVLEKIQEYPYRSVSVIGAWPDGRIILRYQEQDGNWCISWDNTTVLFGREPIDILLTDSGLWVRQKNLLKQYMPDGICRKEYLLKEETDSFGTLDREDIWVWYRDNTIVIYNQDGVRSEMHLGRPEAAGK